jgi:hypothetical protein
MKNFLSDHARIRLKERTSLTEDVLIRLLNSQYCVTVSVQPFSNLLHKLIYSEPDARHFVVVHDVVTGKVITILHLDYEGERAWKVTKKELKLAVRLASPASLGMYRPNPPRPGVRCLINLILYPSGFRPVRAACGSHRFAEMPRDADAALRDPGFVEKISSSFQEKLIPFEEVEEILLTDSDHHVVLRLPWNVLEKVMDGRIDQNSRFS